MAHEACPGCRLRLPRGDGPGHPYIGASPSCWERYGLVLAREYEDPAHFRVHQTTVDTYAVQHPGRRERRAIQSVALHLMTLALVLEDGAAPAAGPAIHKRLAGWSGFTWLEPPRRNGRLTVLDVLAAEGPEEHTEAVMAWARDVWQAWSPHHATVWAWLSESLD